jgi:hypothetical protein
MLKESSDNEQPSTSASHPYQSIALEQQNPRRSIARARFSVTPRCGEILEINRLRWSFWQGRFKAEERGQAAAFADRLEFMVTDAVRNK